MKSTLITDGFFNGANQLRKNFADRFSDPRAVRADRFVWDYFHVPGQYTALRTPAYEFFPKKIYEDFHNKLVWWGRRTLGCHDISPPWMSCYIDGCGQELHGDLPHGPWAFVYSLTPWRTRKFSGGETILLREDMLSYWQGFKSAGGLERPDIIDEIPANFNRLTVFDPRIPHGVNRVEGVHELLQGRLVIHGWFVQPRPFVEGPLRLTQLQSVIDDLSGELNHLFNDGLQIFGMISLQFKVSAAGRAQNIRVLSSALRTPDNDPRIEKALVRHINGVLNKASFGKQRGLSTVTLPLVFEI